MKNGCDGKVREWENGCDGKVREWENERKEEGVAGR